MSIKAKTNVWLLLAVLAARFACAGGLFKAWGGSGEDGVTAIALDGVSNIYVTGSFYGTCDFNPAGPVHSNLTSAANSQDAFLCKYSKDGDLLWARSWGGTNADRGNGVALDAAGNAYIVGCFRSAVDFNTTGATQAVLTAAEQDAFLCKYDTDGNFQWARSWGGDLGEDGYSIAVDATGNAYVVGDYFSPVIDFNANPAPGTDHDWHTNTYFATNTYYCFDAWLCKWAPDGKFQWARTWGGDGYDDCCVVAVDGSNSVYVGGFLGSTHDTCDLNPNTGSPHVPFIRNSHDPGGAFTDVFLSKFDTNGVWQWSKAWGGTNVDAPVGLAVDGVGDLYVAGYFEDTMYGGNGGGTVDFNPDGPVHSNLTAVSGGADAFLCKYSPAGEFKWAVGWGGSRSEHATCLAVDKFGYVYVPGYFYSAPCDSDPGPGVSNLWSHGARDIFLSKFDPDGNFLLARACGGTNDDWVFDVAVDGEGNAYLAGSFRNAVDFGPLCGGPATNSNGAGDAYFCRIPTCCKLTVTKSGNGVSSLGAVSPAVQVISQGVTTQIVYWAADWNRIQALSSNGTVVGDAAGARSYTQALAGVTADSSNDVVFALATPVQTGYTNVPTTWLTNWAENAMISDAAFSVHSKYLLGLDPTTSNTFLLRIEALDVSGSNAVVVVRRTHTGGLSPDGMHGHLELQAADRMDTTFSNVPGTAVTGSAVFDGQDRKAYTSTVESLTQFYRAVIE